MTWLTKAYEWVWFHTELWIASRVKRRPFTFIMRDWIYTHMKAFIAMTCGWYAGVFALAHWHGSTVCSLGDRKRPFNSSPGLGLKVD